MTLEEMIAMMTADQVESRMSAIHQLLAQEGADVDALSHEVDLLEARQEELSAQTRGAEARAALMQRVAGGQTGNVVRTFGAPEGQQEARSYTLESPEYRSAWLKRLAVRDGEYLFGEPTAEERDAFTFLTSNTPALVPTVTLNRIVELVESTYPMYADAQKGQMTSGFSIPRHKAITAGDAKAVAEGAANDDEQDTFDLLTLTGVEIKKHLVISRKMKWQSIDAFESWVVTHIAERIGVAKETRILAQLDNVTYGIAAGNKVASTAADDAGIRALLAKIKGQGAAVVYANNATIWNRLAGIEQGDGTKAFIVNSMVDPVTQGRIYGREVKLDDNLADDVVYIGIPRYLLANDFEALYMNHAMDPKTFEDIVAGYSLFDAGLENPESWVKTTLTDSTGE